MSALNPPENNSAFRISPAGPNAWTSNDTSLESALIVPGNSLKSALPDWLGLLASIGCAIHCAAMPFVIAFLPMLGLSFLADEAFHKVMVIVCTVLAASAFIPGWRKHGKLLPIGIGAAGLCLITVAAFALEGECCASCEKSPTQVATANDTTQDSGMSAPETGSTCNDCECCKSESVVTDPQPEQSSSFPFLYLVTPLGGVLLVTAHLVNRGFSCRCGCCETPTQHDPA